MSNWAGEYRGERVGEYVGRWVTHSLTHLLTHLLKGEHRVFDWTIHPDSRIARLRFPFLQKIALLARSFKMSIASRSYASKYASNGKTVYETPGASELCDTRVFEELELGIEYILAADVIGDIAEFGSHGRTASVICKKLAA